MLYKKGNRYHVVYDTGKGPHTKSGYVNYAGTGGSGGSGGGNDTSIQIPYVSHSQASREQYGTSGKGRPLYAYKIGSGSKVLFAGFALHGWEDNWNNDGLALVKIANELITRLGDYKSKNNGLHGWTVYIAPCMNPDGVIVNGSHNGPGRCTVTTRIDMNRCFPYNFTPQYSSRNYTGPNPLGAPEAVALKNFVQKVNSQSSEMIVIDCHGWMNFTQGNAQIGKYFGNQFGFGHNNRYSSGFFSSWATTLKNTKGVLLEYPTSTYSYNDVINKNYIGKTFNGIVNILKNNSGEDNNDGGDTQAGILIYLISELAEKSIRYNYMMSASSTIIDVNDCILDYLRQYKYAKEFKWEITCGSLNQKFINYVNSNYPNLKEKLYNYIKKHYSYDQFIYNHKIDLPHIATTTLGYTRNLVPDFWSGWGGDLATGMADITGEKSKFPDRSDESISNYVIGNNSFSISRLDILSDIDAIFFAKGIRHTRLDILFKKYYSEKHLSSTRKSTIFADLKCSSNPNINSVFNTIKEKMFGLEGFKHFGGYKLLAFTVYEDKITGKKISSS